MRVESSKVFSILAHELRSPLGVIQGYIRMLRMRRTDDDQEIKMLTAMMDATARISAVARQASELALSEGGEPTTGSTVAVPLSELVSRVATAQLPRPVAVAMPEAVAGSAVRTGQIEALSSAIAAIVVSVERNLPDRTVALRAAVGADGSPLLLVGDERDLASIQPDAPMATDAGSSSRKLFEAGGQGLSLVLAASVLDRHGISVGLLRSSSEIVVLRLPKD